MLTHHITDEQIDEALREIDGIARDFDHYEYGLPLGDIDDGKPHAKMRDAIRAILALRPAAQPAGDLTISTKHGPWLPSSYHADETYCQRCKTRSVFAADRKCDPHIVHTAPAPAARNIAAELSLMVLCAVKDLPGLHANMLKDIDSAIEANRAAGDQAAGDVQRPACGTRSPNRRRSQRARPVCVAGC